MNEQTKISIGNAIKVIKTYEKQNLAVADVLEEYIASGDFSGLGAANLFFETKLLVEYGINFYLSHYEVYNERDLYCCVCNNPCKSPDDLTVEEKRTRCRWHMALHQFPYREPNLNGHDLRKIVATMRRIAARLTEIRKSVYEAYMSPEDSFTLVKGTYYRIVDVDSYIEHIPASEDDIANIFSGLIRVMPDVKSMEDTYTEYISNSDLRSAIEAIRPILQNQA